MMSFLSSLLVILMASRAAGWVGGAAAAPMSARRCGTHERRGASIHCGPRVRIVSVGKPSRDESWITSAIDGYVKRLRSTLELDLTWVKDDNALVSAVERCEEVSIILDERGPTATSVDLADRLFAALEEGGSRMSFFIGGAEGLPPNLKKDRSRLLSLSSLTLTHQMARLLLVEQVYRATEIRKGSGYHKD